MLKKFLSESSANIGIMGAALIGPMLLAAGVGIDLAERYRATQSYQAAVDAAALATAKVLTTSSELPAQARADAIATGEAVFEANILNLHSSQGTITIDPGVGDCTGDGVVATAELTHPMIFDALHKYFADQGTPDEMKIQVSSTVACGNDTVEVAMVLDNSGSMQGNKLSTLKTAAKDLVQTLHNSMTNNPKPNPLKFSLVPFSSMVNVGPQNANASWMDTDGESSIHHEHLKWADHPGAQQAGGNKWVDENGNPLTRFRLYNEMGISWAGCVESRPYPYHTQDTVAGVNNPDGLFVPAFAPDAPDSFNGDDELEPPVDNGGGITTLPVHCKQWRNKWWNKHRCKKWHDTSYSNDTYNGSYHPVEGYANRYGGDYNPDTGEYIGPGSAGYAGGGGGPTPTGNVISEEEYPNNYLEDNHNMPEQEMHLYANNSGTGEGQYSRQRWTWKYFDSPQIDAAAVSNLAGLPGGPNAWCTAVPLKTLTTSKSSIDTAINNMVASGATNVQAGIAWGWRTLSSAEPFSEGRDKQQTDNRKIMIVMTDGNNTYYPSDLWDSNAPTRNPAYYSAFGHNGGQYGEGAEDPKRRIFEGFDAIASPQDDFETYTLAMNEHQIETCENARADGIQIYSIAFQVPEGASAQAVMQACASPGADGQPLYYNASNNEKLKQAFASIAAKIRALSVTK